jgi:hypothetical protein
MPYETLTGERRARVRLACGLRPRLPLHHRYQNQSHSFADGPIRVLRVPERPPLRLRRRLSAAHLLAMGMRGPSRDDLATDNPSHTSSHQSNHTSSTITVDRATIQQGWVYHRRL